MGRQTEAIAEFRRGIGFMEALLVRDPGNTGVARKSVSTLDQDLAQILMYTDPPMAEKQLLKRLPLDAQLAVETPQDPDAAADAGERLQSAWQLCEPGRVASRIAWAASKVLLSYMSISSPWRPDDVAAQRDLMLAYGHVADMLGSPFLSSLGDSKGALENYRKAARIAESMNAADPSNKLARRDLGMVYMRIGAVLATDCEIPDSLKMLDQIRCNPPSQSWRPRPKALTIGARSR